MNTPIDRLKQKYGSASQHLSAITDAIVEQFKLPREQRGHVEKAIWEAYGVGRRTITSDDWCDSF